MNNATRIAVRYAAVAAFSTAINIAVQAAVVAWLSLPRLVELSILAGTAAGLPVKYVLEKRFIFAFHSRDLKHDGRLFTLYSAMGVLTTALFWGTEYVFHLAFDSDPMRYIGGVLGLVGGHIIKYQLDKRYVFVHRSATEAGA